MKPVRRPHKNSKAIFDTMDISCERYDFATPSYAQSILLRDKILRIPLGIEFQKEDLSAEWKDFHLGAFNESGFLCACLVLVHISASEVKMRQVAVDDSLQGKGVGRKLVAYSEQFARYNGYRKIVLNARIDAVPFYLKLNYSKVGSEFIEVSIRHQKMQKIVEGD